VVFDRAQKVAIACLAGLLLGTSQAAHAQSNGADSTLSSLFSDTNAPAPQALSYLVSSNDLRLILDRSQPRIVLLRFDGDPEVWALTSHWGPRGDEFLRNDVGEVMMRITGMGGVTVYGPLGATGALAAQAGRAKPLSAPQRSGGTLQATVERSLSWFSRFASRNVRVEAQAGLPPTLVHEALERAAQGLSRAPRGWFGTPQRRVKLIRVERAARPGVQWGKGVLTIGVVPGLGYAGRPSSAAVRLALVSAA
jgi:Domain of unknown function (DUF4908)